MTQTGRGFLARFVCFLFFFGNSVDLIYSQMPVFEEVKISTQDSLTLSGWISGPSQPPIATVVWLHGFGEHAGRYGELSQRFVEAGMAFIAFDQRGHGLSEGRRGDCPNLGALVNDIDRMVDLAENRYPGIPLILAGHSMGGGLVLHYGLKHPQRLTAILAFSPWLRLAMHPSQLKMLMARASWLMFPRWQTASNLEERNLSHDPIEVDKYLNDPLVHGLITPSLFFAVQSAGLKSLHDADHLTLPCLVMHGTGDLVTSWHASRDFVKKAGRKADLQLWEGLFHELHHEDQRQQVFEAARTWLLKELSHNGGKVETNTTP